MELMKYNNLTTTNLQVGQILKIPEEEVSENEIMVVPVYQNYTVKSGDSIYSIAEKFNTTVNQIKQENNLVNNNLTIGQTLKIQVGEQVMGIEECFGEGYESLGQNYITYTVKKNDNLYQIAKNYETTADAIMMLNNLTSPNLEIGQVLKIREAN